MAPPSVPTSIPLHQMQPTMQGFATIDMKVLPTSQELECPPQRVNDCRFEDLVSLSLYFWSSFHITHIPIRELLPVMLDSCHVVKGLGSADRGSKNVDVFLHTSLWFGRCMQKRPTNSRQSAIILFSGCLKQAKIRLLCDPLDSAEVYIHRLRRKLCTPRVT